MPDRRTQLLDAALAVVADKGMKGLTHRAVDAAAQVAEGTTSNYFRTRLALVEGVLDRLLERDRVDVAALTGAAPPCDARELEVLLYRYVMFATGSDAVRTRARFAMFRNW